MKKRSGLTAIIVGLTVIVTYAQDSIVSIPDTAFLYALIDEGVDANGDSLISYAEAEATISLHVDRECFGPPCKSPISDMSGIEAFINLDTLVCSMNELSSLDVSGNIGLVSLNCSGNQFTSLDLSENTFLEELWCGDNHLSSLYVSGNTALGFLDCGENQLTSLDVSNNTGLLYLICSSNQLSGLDVMNNPALIYLACNNNQLVSLDLTRNTALRGLYCGRNQLSSLDISNNTLIGTGKDCGSYYTCGLDLNYMYSLYEVCVWENFNLDSISHNISGSFNIYFTTECFYNNDSIVFISDPDFLNALIDEGVDTNEDNLISHAEAEAVTNLDLRRSGISDIKGIESFVNLVRLDCRDNELTSLDLSGNTELKELLCGVNQLSTLNIADNAALLSLECAVNELSSLDVSKNTALQVLNCHDNVLTSLDLSNNIALTYLNCGTNQLTSLDVSNDIALTELHCSSNLLTSLDLTNVTALTGLYCHSNQLTSLDVSNNPTLTNLDCVDNEISTLDLSNNILLESLKCHFNELHNLDVSNNSLLTELSCAANNMASLDVSNNLLLTELSCAANDIASLRISHNKQLHLIDVSYSTNLGEICVWTTPFPPAGIEVRKEGSPNLYFTDCAAPELSVVKDSLYQPTIIKATSSETGMVYLAEEDIITGMTALHELSLDSVPVMEDTPFELDVSEVVNGTYYLYASDATGNVSEPVAISIFGVGLRSFDNGAIRLFPNPASSYLVIETGRTGSCSIELKNLNGQHILSRRMSGNTLRLDLSSFQKGIYLISFRSNDQIVTKKIIKH